MDVDVESDTERREGWRLLPVAAGLFVLAAVLVLRHDPLVWIGDNRFEQYDNPARRIARAFTLWDTSRSLGRVREEFWPAGTAVIAIFRAFGAPIGLAEHLWHALLIGTGGLGMVVLVRRWRPAIGGAHVVAALVYMFGPFSVAFLLPSNLYVNYAIAPWVLAIVHAGVRTRGWRYPALLALLVGAVGNVEYAGLMFIVVFGVLLVMFGWLVERETTWRPIAAFGGRALLLGIAVNAAALYKTAAATEVFVQRVRDTETTSIISVASSWAESFRGLGGWLLYINDRTGASRPQAALYFENDAVVLASFVLPIVALLALLRPHRGRAFLGALMFVATALMVGSYGGEGAPPAGRLVAWARDGIPQLGALRNNFKAGSGLLMATAALCGTSAATAWRFREGTLIGRSSRVAVVVGAAAVLLLVSQPFWRGPLYREAWEFTGTPAYVDEFTEWIDEQPAAGRVLVIPGSTRNGFRWGWVNDDYLDARVARSHVTETDIELTRPVAADLLHALERDLQEGPTPGLVAQVARRIGADLIVIRNDHRWEDWGQPRPGELDPVRADPELEFVRAFGAPGEFTASGFDVSVDADRARELPPIEVYRVVDSRSPMGLLPADQVLVSGGGVALTSLQQAGVLDDASVRYTGETSARDLAELISAGTPVVVTDTNRRQEVAVTLRRQRSYTLAEGQVLGRTPIDLFAMPGSQSMASFGAASMITTSEINDRFGHAGRPGLAFDGLEETAWITGVRRSGRSGTLRIEFDDKPVDIDGIAARAALDITNGPRLLVVEVETDAGPLGALRFDDRGVASSSMAASQVSWVEFRIAQVRGELTGGVGLSEIELGGVDVGEWIDTPTDVFERIDGDAALANALAEADISYLFRRNIETGLDEAELRVRRRFETVWSRAFELRGAVALGAEASDELIAAIVASPVEALGSKNLGIGFDGAAAGAVDGDLSTAWLGAPQPGANLALSFDQQPIDSVRVLLDFSNRASLVRGATVEIGGDSYPIDIEMPACADNDSCRRWFTVDLGAPVTADGLRLSFDDVDARGIVGRAELPIIVAEVRWPGSPDQLGPVTDDLSNRCVEGVVAVDNIAVPVRLLGSLSDLRQGRSLPFEQCGELTLAPGSHRFESSVGAIVDWVELSSVQPRADTPPGLSPAAAASALTVAQVGETDFELAITTPLSAEALLTIGQSWHPGWRATIDGVDLGAPVSVDTQTAWRLPAGTQGIVEVRYGPQRRFEVAVLLTLVATAVCIGIVLRARHSEVDHA